MWNKTKRKKPKHRNAVLIYVRSANGGLDHYEKGYWVAGGFHYQTRENPPLFVAIEEGEEVICWMEFPEIPKEWNK